MDLLTCGSLTTAYGRPLGDSQLLEIAAARWELANLREALRQVGRPGMGLLAGQSAVTEAGDLAISHPDFLRTCDAHIIALFNEMMIDNVNMARVVNAETYGMRNASLACVMVGGLGGDAPGAAVVQIASIMLANLACRAHYHLLHPIHIRHGHQHARGDVGAVGSGAGILALCAVHSGGGYLPKSGALTRELLYEWQPTHWCVRSAARTWKGWARRTALLTARFGSALDGGGEPQGDGSAVDARKRCAGAGFARKV